MNTQTMTTQPAQQAPHSCRRCGRVVTKREQHEALEARVLESIRAEHPEWAGADGHDAPHEEHYRKLLRLRRRRRARTRAARLRARVSRRRQFALAMRIVFTVVALAAAALVAPVDLRHYFGTVRTNGGEKR